MPRHTCAPHPQCNPVPPKASPLSYDGNWQAPHPEMYWMSRRTVNVAAGENVDVKLNTDCKTGDKTYTVSSRTDTSVINHLSELDTAVDRKADKTYVNRELAKKADKTYVAAELDKKADKSYVTAELAKKADKTYVNSELAKKADKTYVNTELAKKADKTYVDTELAKKADKTYVDTELIKKADKTYVDTELAKKADKTYVDTELIKKADKTYVDTELIKKADKTYVDTELSGKVDKVEGKGLSSNDYTDADKEKLTTLVVREAAEGGTDVSLVTTGEKFTWDAKQDSIEYYLADAIISGEGSLVITKKDGSTVIFTGNENAAIDHIATIDGNLPIIDKTVTIPMADAMAAGIAGNAGLVKGIYETFNNNGMVEHV